jgi:hypothetical protein
LHIHHDITVHLIISSFRLKKTERMRYLYIVFRQTLLWNIKTTYSCERKNRVSLWISLYEFNCKMKIIITVNSNISYHNKPPISIIHRNTDLSMRWSNLKRKSSFKYALEKSGGAIKNEESSSTGHNEHKK